MGVDQTLGDGGGDRDGQERPHQVQRRDSATAAFGLSAAVAIEPAIALPVSWKPLVKSNASAGGNSRASRREDGHKTVGAALRYQHSQDGSAVGLPREQSPGDAEHRYQGNDGERDAEANESARRVPTRLHHHQVRLMAERVEERQRDARAEQRE